MPDNDTPQNPSSPTDPKPPARKKRRKWPWVILVLFLLIALLVVLLPTIASTPPVRSFVVSKINDNLNGKVEIANWSLGWTSGINVSGVKVFDDRARLILEMARMQTGLSLLNAIRGIFAVGDTNIDGLNFVLLEIDKNGQTNYQKLF